jgi:hypothetical protein
MDPVKTILMLDEESTETTDKYRVKCVNGLTYIVTETGDSIESVEKVES